MNFDPLLSPPKKKESLRGLLSTLGIVAAAATVVVFSTLFFTEVSLTAQSALSFSLSFFLLFSSSYIMYASLFETGRGQGEKEERFSSLTARRTELFAQVRERGDKDSLLAFCQDYSKKETAAAREALLLQHLTSEDELAAWRKIPWRERSVAARRALLADARFRPVSVTPRMLLAEQPRVAARAPLSHSPDRERHRRTLAFLLPLALFTSLSVSLVCEVILAPSPDTVVAYLLKLFTLLHSGLKGFRAGFFHVTVDRSGYMEEQCELLEEYLKEYGKKETAQSEK